jgi:hypothetical protein
MSNPLILAFSRKRLCRNQENCINVILSAAKNLTFPPLTRARSFGYRLRMTLRHNLQGEKEPWSTDRSKSGMFCRIHVKFT